VRASAAATAIVESVHDAAIREINDLESRIVAADESSDAALWEQAERVVAELEAGLSQRKLAAQWMNGRTGEPYSVAHVNYTKQVVVKFTEHPRPRFRDAYNAVANAKTNRLTYQTGDYEWYSPADIVAAARDVLGAIDLDPASCDVANAVVEASRIFTVADNGLEQPWHGRVYMNPPYRQPDIQHFCEKFAQHASAGDIVGIVFVNNATETEWFARLASVATAFCFPSSRCRCWQPDREICAPLQGQVIVYAGPERDVFCRRFGDLGIVLVRP
jgi:hypothetical protein